MAVEDGQDDQRVAAARFHEAVQHLECLASGLAPVDRICEVPGRHRAGLAEVRCEFFGADRAPVAVGGLQRGQERAEPVEVLAQVCFDLRGSRRIQLYRRVRQALGDPAVGFPAADVGVDHGRPGCLEGVHELGRERATSSGHHQLGRGQRLLQVGKRAVGAGRT